MNNFKYLSLFHRAFYPLKSLFRNVIEINRQPDTFAFKNTSLKCTKVQAILTINKRIFPTNITRSKALQYSLCR